MPAPRPETIIMREAREAARDDKLRVTIEMGRDGITRITMEPAPKPVDPNRDEDTSSPRKDSGEPTPGRWQ
jgi:hypothetical protein